MTTERPDGRSQWRPPRPEEQGRTRHGLDANERLPNGEIRARALLHPEEFTRNTGEGAPVHCDRPNPADMPTEADGAILPSDSPGG